MSELLLDTSPFSFAIYNSIELVEANLREIYPDFMFRNSSNSDYFLRIENGSFFRRIYKPQARFYCDQREPFLPMTIDKAFAMLEWGMNWVVASHEMQHVIVHAGVLAKDDKAILFPAPPGSGKSTLTSWLAFNGWRLLSDEMALIQPNTNIVLPFVRPICLKEGSIPLAKSWFPEAKFSTIAKDTHKGNVIHLAPPSESWEKRLKPAKIIGIVYPNYMPSTVCDIAELTFQESFSELAKNAFNYGMLGKTGFETIIKVVQSSKSFEVFHNDVSEVQAFLEQDIIAKM